MNLLDPVVDSLVFISGTPSLVARDDYRHGLPRAEVSSLLRSIKKEYVPGMAGFYKLMFQGDDVHHPRWEKIYALAADTARAPRQEVACEALQSMQQEDLRPHLKKSVCRSFSFMGASTASACRQHRATWLNTSPMHQCVCWKPPGTFPSLPQRSKFTGR